MINFTNGKHCILIFILIWTIEIVLCNVQNSCGTTSKASAFPEMF